MELHIPRDLNLTIWSKKKTVPKLNFAKIVKILIFIHKQLVSVYAQLILIFHIAIVPKDSEQSHIAKQN